MANREIDPEIRKQLVECASEALVPSVKCSGSVVSVRRKGKRRIVMLLDTGETRTDIIPQEVLLKGNVAEYSSGLIGSMFVQIYCVVPGLKCVDKNPVNAKFLQAAVARELHSRFEASVSKWLSGGEIVQAQE